MSILKKNIVLYHGSYCEVQTPDLNKCARFKDFGQGFYLTTSLAQAKAFSKISFSKANNNAIIAPENATAWVSAFEFSDFEDISVYEFEGANAQWLRCVAAHRQRNVFVEVYQKMAAFDIICGKIANDDTNATILAYMSHIFGAMGSPQADSTCIALLKPERLCDQFCFRTAKALSKLRFIGSEQILIPKNND